MKSMLMAIMAVAVAVTFSAPAFANEEKKKEEKKGGHVVVSAEEKKKEEKKGLLPRAGDPLGAFPTLVHPEDRPFVIPQWTWRP
jgi:hypothetical protein